MKYASLQQAKSQLEQELGTLQTARDLVLATVGEDATLEKTISTYQRRLQHIEGYQRMMSESDAQMRIEEANKRIDFNEDPVYKNAVVPMQVGNVSYNAWVEHPFRLFMKKRRGMTEDEYKAALKLGRYPIEKFELSREGGLHWVLKTARQGLEGLYGSIFSPNYWVISKMTLSPDSIIGKW